ncbi:MAG: hypothetical protein KIT09_13430 [Bryobacteraceae bacterium]|nr:hypothetical protein [Bryobacteraceae bacterium]
MKSNRVCANGTLTVEDLQAQLFILATLEPSRMPVVTGYFDLRPGYRKELDETLRAVRKGLAAEAAEPFEQAWLRIQSFLRTEMSGQDKGAAVFARAGDRPFFLALRLQTPVAVSVSVDSRARIFPLIELKDTYHQYALMVATETDVEIVEVSLGAVTERVWKTRPDLRRRVGREWTQRHYRSHRRERTHQFLKEAVKGLRGTMLASGYQHLVLAGEPRALSLVKKALPRFLAARLIACLPASREMELHAVVEASVALFHEHEARESLAKVERLERAIGTGSPAVCGAPASLAALRTGHAEALVIAREFEPGTGWRCTLCNEAAAGSVRPAVCPRCGSVTLADVDLKEEIVHAAAKARCEIETVAGSDALMRLGGVGCLLRFRPAEQYAKARRAWSGEGAWRPGEAIGRQAAR